MKKFLLSLPFIILSTTASAEGPVVKWQIYMHYARIDLTYPVPKLFDTTDDCLAAAKKLLAEVLIVTIPVGEHGTDSLDYSSCVPTFEPDKDGLF